MSPKGFIKGFAGLSFLLLSFLAVMNYIVDPFAIFGTGLFTNYDVNPRYTKLKALTSNNAKYDALIMGSCLSSVLRPEIADPLSGYHYYNLSTHNSHSLEPYLFLRFLMERGRNVKQVLLNLESFRSTLREDYEKSKKQNQMRLDMRQPHFLNGETSIEFFYPYLLSWIATKRSFNALINQWRKVDPPIVETENGYWYWKNALKSYEKDPRSHVENVVLASAWFSKLYKKPRNNLPPPKDMPTDLERLKLFHDFAASQRIDVIYFLPPTWAFRNYGRWEGEASAWLVRKWVEMIDGFWDFSVYSAVTLDPFNFLNRENFKPELGDMVLNTIFKKGKQNFGIFVTKNNVEDYIHLKNHQDSIFAKKVIPLVEKIPFRDWINIDFKRYADDFFPMKDIAKLPGRTSPAEARRNS